MELDYNELLNADGTSEKIRAALDSVYGRTGTGALSTAMSDTFFGINHRQTPNSVKINKDYFGMTFFTRPLMNMSTANLRQVRQFTPLLTSQELSIPRAIRAMLDTDSAYAEEGRAVHGSPLVDEFQAFMPILSNQLISMSGWPDVVVPTFTSTPGAYQEAFSIADGVTDNFSTYDITANFRNIEGDPITLLFLVWCHYQSLVFQGKIVPYHKMIIENEIDYQTRIYRLVLDPTRRFVQKIAACGAAFPLNSSIAAAFNFESDAPINRANDQISISFRCMGAMYNDPILVSEFNKTVASQNSDMLGTDGDRERFFVKLGNDLAGYFNHKGYPYIDPDTLELSWWVRREDYNELIDQLAPDINTDN